LRIVKNEINAASAAAASSKVDDEEDEKPEAAIDDEEVFMASAAEFIRRRRLGNRSVSLALLSSSLPATINAVSSVIVEVEACE
jgi:hypothetical protein